MYNSCWKSCWKKIPNTYLISNLSCIFQPLSYISCMWKCTWWLNLVILSLTFHAEVIPQRLIGLLQQGDVVLHLFMDPLQRARLPPQHLLLAPGQLHGRATQRSSMPHLIPYIFISTIMTKCGTYWTAWGCPDGAKCDIALATTSRYYILLCASTFSWLCSWSTCPLVRSWHSFSCSEICFCSS